ncbi:MAG: polynucleotide adenylyltransferase PcnB [Betaproteobacteria bacterium]|nr:MAG: polynucleotide adenylyltransferase PcnB [Betaproteobacteria bacterium]TMH92120.1 MAG: polynucleotide adenylyltransferase PcnB [Betaproteobacteria bacterium]
MIKKFIRRVLRFGSGSEPRTVPKAQHGIGREAISQGSRKVCEVLHAQGHQAYVVGGAVRDLLLGLRPKDFDVATDAYPEEVHKLFRRSRLIGKRFKLVHVMFGEETVEVSTFRARTPAETDEHGRVLRDNIYGTREDDSIRRDFTINALYYDPASETLLDYHNGLRDLQRKSVRIIGDARARYREDPLRMLRAVRFAAKAGFSIDERTRKPIRELAHLVGNVPPSRVYEEMQKLLLSGHAATGLRELRSEGLHHGLLPLLDVIFEQPMGERFVTLALEQTDSRVRSGKSVSPAFLFAALLWHEVLAAWKKAEQRGLKPIPALFEAMDTVLDIQTDKLAVPRRLTAVMKEIWALQPRFEQRSGRRPFGLLAHERFRAGFDFLVLRSGSGEAPEELAQWWEKFQHSGEAERQAMLMAPQPGERKGRRRRRRRHKSASPPPDPAQA